ncbi:MAG: VanW family protein [Patescibacteria group bacterium]|jgi:vancomycin resistance protein YoaR
MTPLNKEKKSKKKFFWPILIAAIFFVLIDIAAASYLIFEKIYNNKIYPGVHLGQVDLGGKTREQVKKIIEERISDFNQHGNRFNFENNETVIFPIISSFSGDLAHELIIFKTEETVDATYNYGRNKNFWQNLKQKVNPCRDCKNVGMLFNVEDGAIKNILQKYFSPLEQPATDAVLYATTTPNYWKKEIIFKITEEKTGWSFDYTTALLNFKANLSSLKNESIAISTRAGWPSIKKNECQNIEVEAAQFLDKAELTFIYGEKKWPIDKDNIASWLALTRDTNNKIVLDLNSEKIKNFLDLEVATDINIAPINARFEIKDNRVVEFASSRDGQKIDYPKTIASLRSDWLASDVKTVEINVIPEKSAIKNEGVNNLGIKEIIGIGHSNFSVSPKNRIHNISVGADAINGTLIAPGEEFSTNKTLGDVTKETGYLPEMTIKGDKTVPEYGGGLCQVGTTLFRSALESGLPITARRSHSYRVSYYEPAGTDATIYGPWPDLRFINDTENYILIQSRIDGNDIYFDFWGTKDDRVIEKTDPTIYNITKPGPTKLIETTDLEPGQKKCTERAHNGADAYFDYKVTYSSGEIKEERFKSHYVPWQEVCLIGVEKISTTTPEIIE